MEVSQKHFAKPNHKLLMNLLEPAHTHTHPHFIYLQHSSTKILPRAVQKPSIQLFSHLPGWHWRPNFQCQFGAIQLELELGDAGCNKRRQSIMFIQKLDCHGGSTVSHTWCLVRVGALEEQVQEVEYPPRPRTQTTSSRIMVSCIATVCTTEGPELF